MIYHYMQRATYRTPCPGILLLELTDGHYFTLDEREVNCPDCQKDPLYLDALAQDMEDTLKKPGHSMEAYVDHLQQQLLEIQVKGLP